MNYIYGYKNQINNKWYVGQTTMSLKERHRLHLSSSYNKRASDYNCLFHRKIREYGINNFELIILEEIVDRSKLDEREQYWIANKNSFVQNGGYNLTIGGQRRKDSENYLDVRAAFQSLEEIQTVIQEIKNPINLLTELAKKYEVSLSLICSINTGKKYHQDNELYPLRPLKNKVDRETVDIIIALLISGATNQEITSLLELSSDDIVYRINYGRAHVREGMKYPIRTQLTDREVKANRIKELLKEGNLNNKQIANIVRCDPSTVSNINYGKSYKDDAIDYPIRKVKPVSTIFGTEE